MKQVKQAFAYVAILLFSLTTFSCGDDEGDKEVGESKNLVGTWGLVKTEGYEILPDGTKDYSEYTYNPNGTDGRCLVTFKENGSYTGNFNDEDEHEVTIGTWVYSKNVLSLDSDEKEGRGQFKVLSLTSTELIWEVSAEKTYSKWTFKKME